MSFKEKRLEAGLTQKEVAERLGVDQTAVHYWEVGSTKPRASLLLKIAKLYDCAVDDLLKEDG